MTTKNPFLSFFSENSNISPPSRENPSTQTITMSAPLAVLLASLVSLNALPPSECNYVQLTWPGELFALDVCRTYVRNGSVEYRKYACNNTAYTFQDKVYDGIDCTGDVKIIEDVIEFTDGVCDAVGTCVYVMAQSPCDNADTYTILPYLTGNCLKFEDSSSEQSASWACHHRNVTRIRHFDSG